MTVINSAHYIHVIPRMKLLQRRRPWKRKKPSAFKLQSRAFRSSLALKRTSTISARLSVSAVFMLPNLNQKPRKEEAQEMEMIAKTGQVKRLMIMRVRWEVGKVKEWAMRRMTREATRIWPIVSHIYLSR